MPKAASGKEKAPQAPLESKGRDLADDTKEVAKDPLPTHKVLKMFSINIIAQGLPFCRRRVSDGLSPGSRRDRISLVTPVLKCQGVDLHFAYVWGCAFQRNVCVLFQLE